jgi:hypothetical protein
MQININTDAAVVFTNKLERMRRSALPNAVRETLSRVALEVKKKTMPAQAKKSFVNRSPNFFKANSRVEFARGYNIAAMKSTVGFVEQNLKGENNFAVKDLEQQEHGGTIKGRSFVPMKKARISNSDTRLVRKMNRLTNIKKLVNSRNAKGVNWGQRMIKSSVYAKVGGYVLDWRKGTSGTLFRIDALNRKGNNTRVKWTPLYSVKKNGAAKVKSTHFMQRASLLSAQEIDNIYILEAKKQINRLK